jgi:hypothetical protein
VTICKNKLCCKVFRTLKNWPLEDITNKKKAVLPSTHQHPDRLDSYVHRLPSSEFFFCVIHTSSTHHPPREAIHPQPPIHECNPVHQDVPIPLHTHEHTKQPRQKRRPTAKPAPNPPNLLEEQQPMPTQSNLSIAHPDDPQPAQEPAGTRRTESAPSQREEPVAEI